MAPSNAGGYLPGDPRYGLSGDALRQYYSEKPTQWVIFAARPAPARPILPPRKTMRERSVSAWLATDTSCLTTDPKRLRLAGSSRSRTGPPPKLLSRTTL